MGPLPYALFQRAIQMYAYLTEYRDRVSRKKRNLRHRNTRVCNDPGITAWKLYLVHCGRGDAFTEVELQSTRTATLCSILMHVQITEDNVSNPFLVALLREMCDRTDDCDAVLSCLQHLSDTMRCKEENRAHFFNNALRIVPVRRIFTKLIDLGAPVDENDDDYVHTCAASGEIEKITMILDNNPDAGDIDASRYGAMSIPMMAAMSGNVDMLKLLINRGYRAADLQEIKFSLIKRGYVDVCDYMVQIKQLARQTESVWDYVNSVAMAKWMYDHKQVWKWRETSLTFSPIVSAARNNHLDVVRSLIEAHCPVPRNALVLSLDRMPDLDIVVTLIRNGGCADITPVVLSNGSSPMSMTLRDLSPFYATFFKAIGANFGEFIEDRDEDYVDDE